ncbi:MAG: SDR family NAD(P)-dependent oxidoreductase, partial [Chloroflexi bacterium]
MDNHRSVVIVGGTHGIGKELARRFAADQHEVVVIGRDAARAEAAASEVGGRTHGLAFDLANPSEIAPALKNVGPVQYLVLAAIERDDSKVRQYDPARAMRLVTMKIVGNTEVVHALGDRLADDGSILIFGG